jgi:hypothetical protein
LEPERDALPKRVRSTNVETVQGLQALAILVAPHIGGVWRWELIDADGVSVANGFAADPGPCDGVGPARP